MLDDLEGAICRLFCPTEAERLQLIDVSVLRSAFLAAGFSQPGVLVLVATEGHDVADPDDVAFHHRKIKDEFVRDVFLVRLSKDYACTGDFGMGFDNCLGCWLLRTRVPTYICHEAFDVRACGFDCCSEALRPAIVVVCCRAGVASHFALPATSLRNRPATRSALGHRQMRVCRFGLVVLPLVLIAASASPPPPPAWEMPATARRNKSRAAQKRRRSPQQGGGLGPSRPAEGLWAARRQPEEQRPRRRWGRKRRDRKRRQGRRRRRGTSAAAAAHQGRARAPRRRRSGSDGRSQVGGASPRAIARGANGGVASPQAMPEHDPISQAMHAAGAQYGQLARERGKGRNLGGPVFRAVPNTSCFVKMPSPRSGAQFDGSGLRICTAVAPMHGPKGTIPCSNRRNARRHGRTSWSG